MTPERRAEVRHAFDRGLTLGRISIAQARDATEIALGIIFGITGIHGAIIHERPITPADVAAMFLGACTVLGYRGLTIYRDAHAAPQLRQTDTNTHVDVVTRQITERRDPILGIDPA